MEYRKLGKTNLDVSNLSFGASSLGSVFRSIDEKEGIRTVHTVIDHGINFIDVSPYYGLTKAESILGKALVERNRDEYTLSTKAGRYGEREFDFSKQHIISSLEESLKRLQTDYIDILLLHDIEFGDFNEVVEEGIPALHQLKQEGKIRYCGVSGLPLQVFKDVLDRSEIDVILSYCHYSLNDRSLLDLLPLCEKKQIGVINASPLSMGLLSNREVPTWHPASDQIKATCKIAAEYCQQRGEDIAKLAIQFSVNNPLIPTTLVSSANPENMIKNIKWANEPIDETLLHEVLTILAPIQNMTW